MSPKNSILSLTLLLCFLLQTSLVSSCAKRQVKAGLKNANTTSSELRNMAETFASNIATHFTSKSTPTDEILIAFFPTRNNTIDDLPVDLLDFALVGALLKKNIYTVRVEDRNAALDELEFQLSGLGDGNLSAGEMKSPNYFIKINIDENRFLVDSKTRRIERIFSLEIRSVQTQLVVFSELIEQQKEVKLLNNTISF